jgi:hypothetical protein
MSDDEVRIKTHHCSQCESEFKSPSYIYPFPTRCNMCIFMLFQKRGTPINPDYTSDSDYDDYTDDENEEDEDEEDEVYTEPPIAPPTVREWKFCVMCGDLIELDGTDFCFECGDDYHLYKK